MEDYHPIFQEARETYVLARDSYESAGINLEHFQQFPGFITFDEMNQSFLESEKDIAESIRTMNGLLGKIDSAKLSGLETSFLKNHISARLAEVRSWEQIHKKNYTDFITGGKD